MIILVTIDLYNLKISYIIFVLLYQHDLTHPCYRWTL